MSAPIASKRPEEKEFGVDSGASMHIVSKKELSSEEMGTGKRSSMRLRKSPKQEGGNS